MKIGILGNMNNIYFSLARFLADEGYDCELMLYDYEPSHFHPSADTFKTELNFTIRQLEWGDPAHFFRNSRRVNEDLKSFDFLIGNGTAPAYLHRSGRVLDLFIPYGDDLYALPFPRIVHPLRQLPYLALAWHQRKGIQECPYILFDRTNKEFEKIFDKLNYPGKRITMPPPLFYYSEYEETKTIDHPYLCQLKQLRESNELLILQHIRQVWKSGADKWNMKGNDQLILGYASFIAGHPGLRSKLLLFEYGTDVDQTKKLIQSLGINDHVIWFPKMERKYLIEFIRQADLVVGELFHSWNSYCVVAETLAFGKVLMHKRNDEEYRDAYEEMYPMLHASSAATVTTGLDYALKEKQNMKSMGIEGRLWFLKYCVQKPLEQIRLLVQEKEVRRA